MIQNGLMVLDEETFYAIYNGSSYEVKPIKEFKGLAPGYYDNDLNWVGELDDDPLGMNEHEVDKES